MKLPFLRRAAAMFLAIMIVFFTAVGTAQAEEDGLVTLKVLHTNDIHAKINELGKVAAYINAERGSAEHSLYLDAGDIFSGNPVVDLRYGVPMIDILNHIGVDALTIGNHEFDYGQEEMVNRMGQSDFPWLSANTYVTSGTEVNIPQPEPYQIFELDGLTVGVLGLTQAPSATGPMNIVGLEFADPVETAKQYEHLADETDILIALTHIGYPEDQELAAAVDFFDVIIGGHSHTTLSEPTVVNGTPIVQTGANGANVGNLSISYDAETDEVVAVDGLLQPISGLSEVDADVQAKIDQYNAEMDVLLSEEIGVSNKGLDRNNFHSADSSLGNFWTDAMRFHTDADVAFTNTGGIRADIAPGTLTVRDIYTIEPFENEIMTMAMTGAALKDVIQYSYERDGRNQIDLQSSGLHYTILTDETGAYVDARLEVNGEPIQDDQSYVVAVSDYIGSGGSGYDFVGEVLQPLTGKMTEAMINYAKHLTAKGEAIDFYHEGRIAVETELDSPLEPVSIDEARELEDGHLVMIEGVVTTDSGAWGGNGFYIQDKSAGIYVFQHDHELQAGDVVRLTGEKSTYNGELQIASVTDLEVTGKAEVPAPIVVTPSQISEENEAELVRVEGAVISELTEVNDYGTFEFIATVGDESVLVRVDNRTGLVFDEFVFENGDVVSITGVSSQYNGTVQLKPRGQSDIVRHEQTRVPAKISVKDGVLTVADESINLLADGGTLIVDVPADLDKVEVYFNPEQLRKLVEKQATVEIVRLDEVSLILPIWAFADNNELSIVLERLKLENPISVVYDFTIRDGEEVIQEFTEDIGIIFPVNEDEVSDTDDLHIVYLDEKEEWIEINSEFQNGMVLGITKHFSTFTVLELEEAPVDDSTNGPDTGSDKDDDSSAGSGKDDNGKAGTTSGGTDTTTGASQTGSKLPSTATAMFNWMVIGALLITSGGVIWYIARKKIIKA